MAEGDWDYATPTKEGESGPLPGSMVPVPVARDLTPSEMLPTLEAEWANEEAADPLAGMTEDQIEQARIVTDMLIPEGPDRDGFAPVFDQLSAGVQNKIFQTMARSPHLKGLDLIDRIERTLTLDETVEAERWLRGLSPEHRRLLRG